MKDRELLELAAKAAKYNIKPNPCYEDNDWCRHMMFLIAGKCWNPLEFEEDALRLAVRLSINIEFLKTLGGKKTEVSAYPSGRGDCIAIQKIGINKYSATRRAIVKAAAELAK